MYLAIQIGNYRQQVVFCGTNLAHALEAARQAIENESDHYHDVEILALELDIPIMDSPRVAFLSWDKKEQRPVVVDFDSTYA